MALMMLSGIFACGFAESGNGIDRIIEGMSIRDKLAQMVFFSPRTWKAEDAAEEDAAENVEALNDELRDYITEHRFGGFLLFAENCHDAEQVLRLTADLKATTLTGGGVTPLIAVDQEGGLVARLGFGTTGVGNMALAATGDTECARAMAGVYGEELGLLGIDVDFAPVADVNDNAANPVIGVRSFGDDAGTVGDFATAYMAGLRDEGVVACVKHFPGHGNTDTDSHTGLPLVDRSHDELMANELVPFKAAVDGGVDMVMTAHIQFPQVEQGTYVSAATGEEIFIPATMSKTILTDILRGELGFEGVIVSDALDMKAVAENIAPEDTLAMCIRAGVDMMILPAVRDAEGLRQVDGLLDSAVERAENGDIDVARLDESVRRILTLKQKYGLLDAAAEPVTDEQVAAAVAGCGSAEHRQTAWDIAEKSLTLLKNENDAFPMQIGAGEKTLILFTAASRAGAGELSAQILEDMGALPEGATIESMVIEPDTAEDCVAAAKEADQVLLVSRAWAVECLDPATEDGFPVGVVNQVIDDLHAAGKTAVVISAQLPYDAACYPEADALLLSYGSSAMRSAPGATEGAGSAWAPNLPAAICAASGAANPGGTLPVNLPALDDDYHLTEDILYARQISAQDNEASEAVDGTPDYAADASWVTKPKARLRDVDTFFILPTVSLKNTDIGNDDFTVERNAARYVKTLGMEQGIVTESTDVYAPFYRQATMGCYLDENGMLRPDWQDSPDAVKPHEIAYNDIRAAWLYYMEHYNEGRPVVIFGFSQGAYMGLQLLAEFGDEPPLSDQLVAAYLIGARVDESFLAEHPWIKMAQGATDTGVVISYNAMDARAAASDVKECAINPLNWRTDDAPAGKEKNLGYVTADYVGQVTQEIPAYCGAYLDPQSGLLVVTEAEDLDALYGATDTICLAGDYHLYDLSFFYRNLQKNVADRVESFMQK